MIIYIMLNSRRGGEEYLIRETHNDGIQVKASRKISQAKRSPSQGLAGTDAMRAIRTQGEDEPACQRTISETRLSPVKRPVPSQS